MPGLRPVIVAGVEQPDLVSEFGRHVDDVLARLGRPLGRGY